MPGGTLTDIRTLERRKLHGTESGSRDVGKLGLDISHRPVETMENVAILDGCWQTVIGSHDHPRRAHREHQRKEIPFDRFHDVRNVSKINIGQKSGLIMVFLKHIANLTIFSIFQTSIIWNSSFPEKQTGPCLNRHSPESLSDRFH